MNWRDELLNELFLNFNLIKTPDFLLVKGDDDSLDLSTKEFASNKDWSDFARDEMLYCQADLLSFFCPEYALNLLPGFIGNIAIHKDTDTIIDSIIYYLKCLRKDSDCTEKILNGFTSRQINCIKMSLVILKSNLFLFEKEISDIDLYVNNLSIFQKKGYKI